MSEKRFVYEEEHFPVTMKQIRDTQNNETYDLKDVCELLNNLHQENEQLHHLKVLANAFIVEKGLEVEFVKWCVEE